MCAAQQGHIKNIFKGGLWGLIALLFLVATSSGLAFVLCIFARFQQPHPIQLGMGQGAAGALWAALRGPSPGTAR